MAAQRSTPLRGSSLYNLADSAEERSWFLGASGRVMRLMRRQVRVAGRAGRRHPGAEAAAAAVDPTAARRDHVDHKTAAAQAPRTRDLWTTNETVLLAETVGTERLAAANEQRPGDSPDLCSNVDALG